MNSRTLSIVAACVLGLCFIFYVVSNAVPSWAKASEGSFTIGLWKSCVKFNSKTTCANFACVGSHGGICDKIKAARAFMTLACLVSGVAVILLITMIVLNKSINSLFLLIIKILPIVCLLMGIIGVGLGADGTRSFGSLGTKKLSLGPAAIVGIIGILINLVAAILTFLIKNEV